MKRILPFLLCLLLPLTALAQEWSIPGAGLRLDLPEGWVLTPMGETDLQVRLPQGVEITLQIAKEGAVPTAADYERPPYEHVAFSQAHPDCLGMDWTLLSGDEVLFCARYVTWQGERLYVYTAVGAALGPLYEALDELLEGLVYQPLTPAVQVENTIQTPPAIPDDGERTPVSLPDFTGLTEADTTPVTVQTLPGAQAALITASDTLYQIADDTGLCSFSLSTRRERIYSYSLMVKAEGRSNSTVDFTLERKLAGSNADAAYRKAAVGVDSLGYDRLLADPGRYAGTALRLRGKVSAFSDLDGFPCVLIYTSNPAKGVWENPVWVRLASPWTVSAEEIRTVYGDVLTQALDYEGQALPVLDCRGFSED